MSIERSSSGDRAAGRLEVDVHLERQRTEVTAPDRASGVTATGAGLVTLSTVVEAEFSDSWATSGSTSKAHDPEEEPALQQGCSAATDTAADDRACAFFADSDAELDQVNMAQIPAQALRALNDEPWKHADPASLPAWRDKPDSWISPTDAALNELSSQGYGGDFPFGHDIACDDMSPSQLRTWEEDLRMGAIPMAGEAGDMPQRRTARRICRVKRSGGASQPRAQTALRSRTDRAQGGDVEQYMPSPQRNRKKRAAPSVVADTQGLGSSSQNSTELESGSGPECEYPSDSDDGGVFPVVGVAPRSGYGGFTSPVGPPEPWVGPGQRLGSPKRELYPEVPPNAEHAGLDRPDHMGRTALHVAAAAGRPEIVHQLLVVGCNASKQLPGDFRTMLLPQGQTDGPNDDDLQIAAAVNFRNIDDHADADSRVLPISFQYATPLHLAAYYGHEGVVEMLLAAPSCNLLAVNSQGMTALHVAAHQGFSGVVNRIASALANRDDINLPDNLGQTALHHAAARGHGDTVDSLWKMKGSLDAADQQGWTALHHAAAAGYGSVVHKLVIAGSLVHSTDKQGLTAAHLAAQCGYVEALESLIKGGYWVDTACGIMADGVISGVEGATALHLAAQHGDCQFLQKLIQAGASLHMVDGRGYTALHYAALGGKMDTFDYLLGVGLSALAVDQGGVTVLHVAAMGGCWDICKHLMDMGCNIAARSLLGRTPLHFTATARTPEVVQGLMELGCDINTRDHEGNTLWHLVAEIGNNTMLVFLMDQGCDLDLRNTAGCTAIHIAARAGCLCTLKLLIKKGADLDGLCGSGKTALHYAASHGHRGVVDFLLDVAGTDEFLSVDDNAGWTALHYAATHGDLHIMDRLLDFGCDMDIQTTEGWTPLHLTARERHVEAASRLLDLGCEGALTDAEGCTPLHLAARQADLYLFTTLYCHESCVTHTKDMRGFTPLHYAVEGGNIDIVDILLLSGEYDDAGPSTPRTTPLHVAMQHGHIDMLPMLTSRGYSPLEKTAGEQTTVHLAAQGVTRCETLGAGVLSEVSHEQCITAMLGVGVDPKALDASGCSALHYGAASGNERVFELVHGCGLELDLQDNRGWSPLFWASNAGRAVIVERLLALGANINIRDTMGRTALHWAADRGHANAVAVLAGYMTEHELDVHAPDADSNSPAQLAAGKGHVEVVAKVLDSTRKQSDSKLSALHLAVQHGLDHLVRQLLDLPSANPNVQDIDGLTPLHWAACKGFLDIAEQLLSAGADVNKLTNDKWTALHEAATNGHEAVSERLIQAGTDVDVTTSNGSTALHNAAANGHLTIVQMLLHKGCNVKIQAMSGATALYGAATGGFLDIVVRLVEARSDVNQPTSSGLTPLHTAASGNHFAVVEHLLSAGADKDYQAMNGVTPLHGAAMNGHSEVVNCLLAAGCDPDIQNSNGNTALHLAASKGHLEIVEALLGAGADLHIKNSKVYTAVHSGAIGGFFDVVLRLVRQGALWKMRPDCDVVKMITRKSQLKASYVEGRLKLAEKERQRKEKAKIAVRGAHGPTEAQLQEAAARAEANAQALLAEEEKQKEVDVAKRQKKKKEKEKKKKAGRKAGEEDIAAAGDERGQDADAEFMSVAAQQQAGPPAEPSEREGVALRLPPASKKDGELRRGNACVVSDSPRPDGNMGPLPPTPPQVQATGAAGACSSAENTPSPHGAAPCGDNGDLLFSSVDHDEVSSRAAVAPATAVQSPAKTSPPEDHVALGIKLANSFGARPSGASEGPEPSGRNAERHGTALAQGVHPAKGGGVRSPSRHPQNWKDDDRHCSPARGTWETSGGLGKPNASKRAGMAESPAQNGAIRQGAVQSLSGPVTAQTAAPKLVGQGRRAGQDNSRHGSAAGPVKGSAKAEDAGIDRSEKGRSRQRRLRREKQRTGDQPAVPERSQASPRRNPASSKQAGPEASKPPAARLPAWGRGMGQAGPPTMLPTSKPLGVLAPAGRQYADAAKGTLTQAAVVDASMPPQESDHLDPPVAPSSPEAVAAGKCTAAPLQDIVGDAVEPLVQGSKPPVAPHLPDPTDPGVGAMQTGNPGQVAAPPTTVGPQSMVAPVTDARVPAPLMSNMFAGQQPRVHSHSPALPTSLPPPICPPNTASGAAGSAFEPRPPASAAFALAPHVQNSPAIPAAMAQSAWPPFHLSMGLAFSLPPVQPPGVPWARGGAVRAGQSGPATRTGTMQPYSEAAQVMRDLERVTLGGDTSAARDASSKPVSARPTSPRRVEPTSGYTAPWGPDWSGYGMRPVVPVFTRTASARSIPEEGQVDRPPAILQGPVPGARPAVGPQAAAPFTNGLPTLIPESDWPDDPLRDERLNRVRRIWGPDPGPGDDGRQDASATGHRLASFGSYISVEVTVAVPPDAEAKPPPENPTRVETRKKRRHMQICLSRDLSRRDSAAA